MSEQDAWLEGALHKLETMPPQALEMREAALSDLNTFARLVNPGYLYGEIHTEIFRWLQQYSLFGNDEDLSANKLIMLPRAHLKSHMVATWCAWIIAKHPEITILYVSATAELATTQLYAIQNILLGKSFTRFFPEYVRTEEGKREGWTQSRIKIDHPQRKAEAIRDPTIATAGLTTNTTGWHADIVVADDLVVPENAYTEEGRNSVSKKSSQFTSIRNAGGFTLACGTRYHPSDIYDVWRRQEYDVFDENDNVVERLPVWEIQEYKVEEDNVFIWPRAHRGDGKAFGFDVRVLSRIRAEYSDRTQFHAQYYNDPNDSSTHRIQRDKFQYADKKHLYQEGGYWYYKKEKLNIYASIDFAFSLNKKADYSAIVVLGVDSENMMYVLDISRFKTDKIAGYFDEIIKLHSKWEFKKLRAEVNVAQSIISRDLKDRIREEGLRLSIEEHRPSRHEGVKEERIAAALEHRYDNMQMWHFRGGYTDVLEEELVMARPSHDDIKDALASVVEISVKPKRARNGRKTNILQFNNRFGGSK